MKQDTLIKSLSDFVSDDTLVCYDSSNECIILGLSHSVLLFSISSIELDPRLIISIPKGVYSICFDYYYGFCVYNRQSKLELYRFRESNHIKKETIVGNFHLRFPKIKFDMNNSGCILFCTAFSLFRYDLDKKTKSELKITKESNEIIDFDVYKQRIIIAYSDGSIFLLDGNDQQKFDYCFSKMEIKVFVDATRVFASTSDQLIEWKDDEMKTYMISCNKIWYCEGWVIIESGKMVYGCVSSKIFKPQWYITPMKGLIGVQIVRNVLILYYPNSLQLSYLLPYFDEFDKITHQLHLIDKSLRNPVLMIKK